jgi:benzoylformate decarboxylase
VGTAALGSIGLGLQDLLAQCRPPARALPPPWPRPPQAAPPPVGERLSAAYVLQTLAETRRPDSIVVEEAPSARPVMHERLPILRPETFHEMCSGGLGFGMAAAVGVALAQPAARVIGLMGDGSAMYSIQALWNAARAKLPITFLILNNGRYAALQDFAPRFGFAPGVKPEGSDLSGLDFLALAAGHGVPARRVRSAAELHEALPAALQSDGPILLDIEVA